MKKKMLVLFTAMMMAVSVISCGKKEENADIALKDMDVDKYVTLGEYKGLEVNVPAASVDEEMLKAYTDDFYLGGLGYATGVTIDNGITDRAVAEGDIVSINYVGKKDDVAFDGGSADGYYLGIGSGTFIPGFEDGLVGAMPGDTLDLNLTFPEAYGNAELAGAEVVFTVTVNYILPEGYNDELIAAFSSASGLTEITNAQEMQDYVYDYLYNISKQQYDYSVSEAVINAFMDNCVFNEVPQDFVSKYENAARTSVEQGAAASGMDQDSFAQQYYGYPLDELIATIPRIVKENIALQAVANRENLNITDEELNERLLKEAENAGFTTVEEYIGTNDIEDYREYYMMNDVLNFLIENSVIKN